MYANQMKALHGMHYSGSFVFVKLRWKGYLGELLLFTRAKLILTVELDWFSTKGMGKRGGGERKSYSDFKVTGWLK